MRPGDGHSLSVPVRLDSPGIRGRRVSFGIPEGAHPGLVTRMRGVMQTQALTASILGVAAQAAVVNLVELLCTAGLPAVYTALLAQQQLGAAAHQERSPNAPGAD